MSNLFYAMLAIAAARTIAQLEAALIIAESVATDAYTEEELAVAGLLLQTAQAKLERAVYDAQR